MKSTTMADELWVVWAWISGFPLLACLIYRFLTQETFKSKELPSYKTDLIIRVLLFPGLIFYIADSLLIVGDYSNFNWCYFGSIFHHIVTLAGAKATLTIPHYPWFFLAPFVFHTLLMIFPEITVLNYFYLLTIIVCLKGLLEEPWVSIKSYNWALKVSICLVCGPIVVLWWNSCSNAVGA